MAVAAPPGEKGTRSELEDLRALSRQRSDAELRAIAWWDAGAVRRWNEIARGLAVSEHMNSAMAARMFALLAVAQHDALVATWHHRYRFKRPAPDSAGTFRAPVLRSERFSYPSEDAAVAAASASVLSDCVKPDEKFLWRNAEMHRDSRVWAGSVYPSDAKAGYEIGLAVGKIASEWGDADSAATAHRGLVAPQPGKWWTERQTMPGWGRVKPWLMKSAADFRAPEPPKSGSSGFQAAVREVRRVADTRSGEQLLLAQYWDLGVGAISVPGMWDEIGINLMTQKGFSEPRMARALALANMAMMDASIACWETKYHYRVRRPSMIDSEIACAMAVPEHPSYPSGHAAFSGAASAVFGYVLPDRAPWLNDLASQAAMSRLYGGLHYRFDNDAGLKQGRAVAALAIERAKHDGCPAK
jgi:membrane-associated phospholipid phosphatase